MADWLSKIFRTNKPAIASSVDLKSGDLVSVLADEGNYAVAKILEKDEFGVHIRLYVQRFESRPLSVEPSTLDTAPFGSDHDDVPFSIGHMPLSFQAFDSWHPMIVHRELPVTEDELEGYRMWQEAEGGYF